jgi:shikimate kinase
MVVAVTPGVDEAPLFALLLVVDTAVVVGVPEELDLDEELHPAATRHTDTTATSSAPEVLLTLVRPALVVNGCLTGLPFGFQKVGFQVLHAGMAASDRPP